MREQLAHQDCYAAFAPSIDLNSRPVDRKSNPLSLRQRATLNGTVARDGYI